MSLYAGSGTIEINLQAQGYLPFTLLKDYGIHKTGSTVWGKQRIDSTRTESNYVEVYGTREKIPHGNRFNTILKDGISKTTNENKIQLLDTKQNVTYSAGAISPEQRKKQIKTIVIVAIVLVVAYLFYKAKK